MAFPDSWSEVALVSLYRQGDATTGEVEFAALTETIDINEGDYPGESMPNLAGGRIWKQSSQEDGEVTLEMYPVHLLPTTGGLFQQYNGVSGAAPAAYDTSQPLTTDTSWTASASRIRDQWRVSILWTNDPSTSNAAAATAASTESLRFYAQSCRIVSHKVEFTDGVVKATVTLKFPSFNKAGTTKNYAWQSDTGTGLGALGAYS